MPIKVGYTLSELTGQGFEYLVVNGLIIAKFYDGNLLTDSPKGGNSDITV